MSWPLVALSELCEINIGKTPARAKEAYWGDGHPWLSIADMNQGLHLSLTKEQITDLAVKETNIKLVPTGTVLFSFKLSIGKIGITQIPMYTNEAIAALPIIDELSLCKEYLVYALSQMDASKTTDRAVMGATLNKRKLAELKIPLPPLDEQKRIAAILDKADAIRRKRQQAIELADEFLRSVFLDMFGDPVTNPKGWEIKRFGDVVDSQLGKMLSKKAKEGKSPKKYLRNANVRWRQLDLKDMFEMDFSDKEIEKFKLQNGDLLVCEGGDVGRCAIWRDNLEDCYFQKALHRVRPNKTVLTSEYIQEYFFWMSRLGGLSDSVSEVTFSHLTAEKLKELKIPVPPFELQKRFTNLYHRYERLNMKNNISELGNNECFSSLSQKAFAGEL